MRVVVASLDDFKPGERRVVRVGGRSIGVFRFEDGFYAIRNRCPHQGGPLCEGHVGRALDAPGEVSLREGSPFIACPWHGWECDLATGQSYAGGGDPGTRAYPVSVEPGARIPGPYVAETFTVVAEENYVVLHA